MKSCTWPQGVSVGRCASGDVTVCTYNYKNPMEVRGFTVQLSREEAKAIAEELLRLASAGQ